MPPVLARLLLTATRDDDTLLSITTEAAPVTLEPIVRSRPPLEALRGSLDLLVLKTLSLSAAHGWGISQRIQQMSGGEFEMNQGSLYPALQRLEHQGWVKAKWGVSEQNRRARFYALTKAGHLQLEKETALWERLAAAVTLVVRTT